MKKALLIILSILFWPIAIPAWIIWLIWYSRKKKDTTVKPDEKPFDESKLIQNITPVGEKLLSENLIDKNEKIIVKLKGSFGEGLVITNKRLYVLKWGYMTGNTFGGRCNAFEYRNITGLEIRKNVMTGTFEVLTPATQNAQKSYWGTGSNSATNSDNVITFQQTSFALFQEATRKGREMISKSISKNGSSGLSDLEKLAELKKKGVITKEEFETKKKSILDL